MGQNGVLEQFGACHTPMKLYNLNSSRQTHLRGICCAWKELSNNVWHGAVAPKASPIRHNMLHFRRAMLCISSAYAITWCPSVCLLSDTFVYSNETSRPKRIFKFFSPSRSHTILVFPYQTTLEQYRLPTSDEDPLTGAAYAGGLTKIALLTNIWLSNRWLL